MNFEKWLEEEIERHSDERAFMLGFIDGHDSGVNSTDGCQYYQIPEYDIYREKLRAEYESSKKVAP